MATAAGPGHRCGRADGRPAACTAGGPRLPDRPAVAVPRPVEGTSPYLPGLDGIRAIAVLAVIVFHLNFSWASGGLLGVQVFFVLSGYLITDLLVAEYRRHRGIALAQFWIRRARRLLPALFVVLFVTVGWATLFDRSQLAALRSDLPSAHLLLQQLVVHLPPRLLLRPVRPAVAARPPVVALHRGAVLPDLAATGPGRHDGGSTTGGP